MLKQRYIEDVQVIGAVSFILASKLCEMTMIPERLKSKITNPSEYSELRSNVDFPDGILVTAIVSTYNSEKFIAGCIESLVSQTLYQSGKLEILVIDSNSAQSEGQFLKTAEEKYSNITYLKTKVRETLYQAWNRAIKIASGKYVTNANTDDRHSAIALEVLSDALNNDPEAVLAYGDLIVTTTENEKFECCTVEQYIRYPEFDPYYQIHFGQCGPQPLWRKNLHEKYGWFAEGFRICADYEWWLRISRYEKFIHVPRVVGLYLDSPTSIEHREPEKCQTETDMIRNFYAKSAGISLNFSKYPVNIFNSYFPEYSSAETALTYIVASETYTSAYPILSRLYESVAETPLEVILLADADCNLVLKFSEFGSKLRIRSAPKLLRADSLARLGLAALHANSKAIAFLSESGFVNKESVSKISNRFAKNDCQVLILDGTPDTGYRPEFILQKGAFASSIFAPLRTARSIEQVNAFMQQLSLYCK